MFIPSGTVTHKNVAIHAGETRYSFTMYTVGGLFHYGSCGMRTVKEVKEKDEDGYARYIAEGLQHWEKGWKQYSMIAELIVCIQSSAA